MVSVPIVPSPQESVQARDLRDRLRSSPTAPIALQDLPSSVQTLVQDALEQVAGGRAVSLASLPPELTTQQAATVLGVSRPFVIKLLTEGELAYRRVGSHRRIALAEVLAYQERSRVERFKALDALIEDGQDLGMGY